MRINESHSAIVAAYALQQGDTVKINLLVRQVSSQTAVHSIELVARFILGRMNVFSSQGQVIERMVSLSACVIGSLECGTDQR